MDGERLGTEVSERRSYPIYILLDVSASMRVRHGGRPSAQAEFTTLIPDMIMALADAPALAETAWISVIAFSDRAELLCPMTSLATPANIRAPRDGAQTDYAAALRFLRGRYDDDVLTMRARASAGYYRVSIARPLVFFITDGAAYAADRYQDPAEWLPIRDDLVHAPVDARIATIGLHGAHPKTLWALATGARSGRRNAFIADPRARGDGLARSVVNVIERSIKLSVRAGALVMDEPPGMHRVVG
jgi:uncharacterized protein YegL